MKRIFFLVLLLCGSFANADMFGSDGYKDSFGSMFGSGGGSSSSYDTMFGYENNSGSSQSSPYDTMFGYGNSPLGGYTNSYKQKQSNPYANSQLGGYTNSYKQKQNNPYANSPLGGYTNSYKQKQSNPYGNSLLGGYTNSYKQKQSNPYANSQLGGYTNSYKKKQNNPYANSPLGGYTNSYKQKQSNPYANKNSPYSNSKKMAEVGNFSNKNTIVTLENRGAVEPKWGVHNYNKYNRVSKKSGSVLIVPHTDHKNKEGVIIQPPKSKTQRKKEKELLFSSEHIAAQHFFENAPDRGKSIFNKGTKLKDLKKYVQFAASKGEVIDKIDANGVRTGFIIRADLAEEFGVIGVNRDRKPTSKIEILLDNHNSVKTAYPY